MAFNFFNNNKSSSSSGGGKVKITVTDYNNKVIESDEKTVNLRKTLMANGVDVYPLRAKITGKKIAKIKCSVQSLHNHFINLRH